MSLTRHSWRLNRRSRLAGRLIYVSIMATERVKPRLMNGKIITLQIQLCIVAERSPQHWLKVTRRLKLSMLLIMCRLCAAMWNTESQAQACTDIAISFTAVIRLDSGRRGWIPPNAYTAFLVLMTIMCVIEHVTAYRMWRPWLIKYLQLWP
jgi:hypothetical protein